MSLKPLFLVLILYFFVRISLEDLQQDIEEELRTDNKTFKSLSRKRRYLVFPEGSSFQLVFCLTYPSVGGGAIFVYGSTAALAWELPSEPIFLEKKKLLKDKKKPEPPPPPPPPPPPDDHMPWDSWDQPPAPPPMDDHPPPMGNGMDAGPPPVKYLSDAWMSPNRKSYYNPFLGGYAGWGKKSDDTSARYTGQRRKTQNSLYRKEASSSLHPIFHEIHRRTRRELYAKIEQLFTALSKDGRACLLKAICEVGKAPKGKGTFMEEIIKAIFKSKPHENYRDEDEYDQAANDSRNCGRMYPTCEGSIWDSMFMMSNKKV